MITNLERLKNVSKSSAPELVLGLEQLVSPRIGSGWIFFCNINPDDFYATFSCFSSKQIGAYGFDNIVTRTNCEGEVSILSKGNYSTQQAAEVKSLVEKWLKTKVT